MSKIKLPKKRQFKNTDLYAQYDKGFNHALMICKHMAKGQGFEVVDVDEYEGDDEEDQG